MTHVKAIIIDTERLKEAAIALYNICVLADDPPIWECDEAWGKFAEALGRDFAADMKPEESTP